MTAITILFVALAALLSLPAWALLLLTLLAGRRPNLTQIDTVAKSPEIPKILGGLPDVSPLPAPAQQAPGLTVSASTAATPAPRVAVLVPAHNESAHLLPTLHCLLAQLRTGDRLLVIADNCQDDTAQVAAQAGATVVVRHHATERGKGYALACGVEALRADPPDVVVVVDSDCLVSDQGIAKIAAHCHASQHPVQMLDLMRAPAGAGLRIRVLEFAWRVKNWVRPSGAQRLGGACHLMGTGMALPWSLIATAQLATGHIAEDMALGVSLALHGHPTQFFQAAQVTSFFPTDAAVARAQKTRWEHGHLRTLSEELPRLLAAALRRGSWSLWVLALDLLIPPLALYFLLLAVLLPTAVAMAVAWPAATGLATAAWLMLAATLAFGSAVGLAWWRDGRDLLSLRELASTPLYALRKLPVYLAYLLRRRSGWVRTQR